MLAEVFQALLSLGGRFRPPNSVHCRPTEEQRKRRVHVHRVHYGRDGEGGLTRGSLAEEPE